MGDERKTKTTLRSDEPVPQHLTKEVQKKYDHFMLNDDIKGFKSFIRDTFPALKDRPDYMLEVMFHKGRVNRAGIPEQLSAQSAAWLQTKGISPLMPEAKPEGWKEENRK